jgi:hypothetical protein
MLRPRGRNTIGAAALEWPLLLEWPMLLGAALLFAWAAALLANSLRILAIVHFQPTLEHWLPPGQAHRLLGLLIYLPALNLQLLLAERRHWRWTVLLACGLYALIMLMVPLLTGNAAAHPAEYLKHALMSLAVMLPIAVVAYSSRARRNPRAP